MLKRLSLPVAIVCLSGALAAPAEVVDELQAGVDVAPPPADKRDGALERIDELEEALVTHKPDPATAGYVKGWFARNVPGIAGASSRWSSTRSSASSSRGAATPSPTSSPSSSATRVRRPFTPRSGSSRGCDRDCC